NDMQAVITALNTVGIDYSTTPFDAAQTAQDVDTLTSAIGTLNFDVGELNVHVLLIPLGIQTDLSEIAGHSTSALATLPLIASLNDAIIPVDNRLSTLLLDLNATPLNVAQVTNDRAGLNLSLDDLRNAIQALPPQPVSIQNDIDALSQ